VLLIALVRGCASAPGLWGECIFDDSGFPVVNSKMGACATVQLLELKAGYARLPFAEIQKAKR
jgi:hypothetical protein